MTEQLGWLAGQIAARLCREDIGQFFKVLPEGRDGSRVEFDHIGDLVCHGQFCCVPVAVSAQWIEAWLQLAFLDQALRKCCNDHVDRGFGIRHAFFGASAIPSRVRLELQSFLAIDGKISRQQTFIAEFVP
ncbi:hypothetical protein ACETRX_22665 [Labrys portucalensis]|uniref:Uncharacterized protein n=1 Tax=Labrys neptuniae TaxID=376174 RepID=A0ABV6ZJU6_9HYPH